MKILGYTYDAHAHCLACTLKKFSVPQNLGNILDSAGVPINATDREGNKIHPIFSDDEQLETVACGDCHAVIVVVQPENPAEQSPARDTSI